MAEISVITTVVGQNGYPITIGTGSDKASAGSIALGVDSGKRNETSLGENSIDIKTSENGIFIGNSGGSTAFGEANTDYVVFKIGGTEKVLSATQFAAMLEAAKNPSPIPQASTTDPSMDGTASPGELSTYARADHIHPSDTSKVPATRTVNGKALSADITLGGADIAASDGISNDNVTALLTGLRSILSGMQLEDGTAEHPFLIKNVDDLEQLRLDVANGDCKEGKYFLQTNDIDMKGVLWIGIGLKNGDGPDRTHAFKGIYDGGSHSINNLKFAYDDSKDVNELMGFFRSCVGATIKNLTINVLGIDAPASTSQKFGGAAFVGTMADGITMINCTANGNLGTEKIPCKHTTAGIIANVDFPSVTAHGQQIIDLSFVTNNANIYTIRKGAGIIGFLLHDVTMRNVTNNGLIKRVGPDNGRDEGVAGLIAWENMDSGDGYLAEYVLDNVANTGAIETNQGTYKRYSSQLVGSWGISPSGTNVNLGDVKITMNGKSLPLGGNIQTSGTESTTPMTALNLWFGEIKADGYCHVVNSFENNGEYIYLFNNVKSDGNAYTPSATILSSGYTVIIDQRFGTPNITDASGTAITGVQIEGTTKWTYTAS